MERTNTKTKKKYIKCVFASGKISHRVIWPECVNEKQEKKNRKKKNKTEQNSI